MNGPNLEIAAMHQNRLFLGFLLSAVAASAFALDSACHPILAAGEARMKQSAWHSVTVINGSMRRENIKVDGHFFSQMDGKWTASAINFDTAEKDMLAQIRSGEVKITHCQSVGTDTVDGVLVQVVKSRIEMKGAPAADATLYVGKSDGLPYKQTGASVLVTYKYKNIATPKL